MQGFHVEVKRHERIEIGAWMEQAERDAAHFGDGWPCVFFRRSREGWRVCMPLEVFVRMYLTENRKETGEKGVIADDE